MSWFWLLVWDIAVACGCTLDSSGWRFRAYLWCVERASDAEWNPPMLRFLRWLSSKLEGTTFHGEDATPYLSRFDLIRLGSWRLYLHNFHRADMEDPGVLHTHPWAWSVSLVLTGGYTEERISWWLRSPSVAHWAWITGRESWDRRRVKPFRLNVFRRHDAHRITELHGEVWTLFLAGPVVEKWGFLVLGRGFVRWRDRLAERGIPT